MEFNIEPAACEYIKAKSHDALTVELVERPGGG